jgi:hypothetical protein
MTEIRMECPPSMPVSGVCAGTGLKHEHAEDIFHGVTRVDFFEIHAENYMGAGGPPHHLLRRICRDYPLSIHGVGLSIGGADSLDRDHLQRLRKLIGLYEPSMFSEHLAWSTHDGVFMNDLLPLPYNAETLAHIADHIDEIQQTLGRRILLENPSTYVRFESSDIDEVEFLRMLARRTGCGLLLDVNNVYVSAVNHGFDAVSYIDSFPVEYVDEIHLGGFAEDSDADGNRLLIDVHGSETAEAVWALYRRVLSRAGPVPTLIEWDNDVPSFSIVAGEVERAQMALAAEVQRRNRMAAA